MKDIREAYQKKFHQEIAEVDNIIKNNIKSLHPEIKEGKNRLLEAGGKRIRPVMLLIAARFAESELTAEQRQHIIKQAAALEVLHMATLVHDDIIDSSEIRRGETSVVFEQGTEKAILFGDYLLTQGYQLLHQSCSRDLLLRIDRNLKAICEGVFLELSNRYNQAISSRDYLRQIRRKTALLFGTATYLGAFTGGTRGRKLFLIYQLGIQLGMAFQIQDDLLDFFGQEKDAGKPINQDIRQGIYSLPVICLLEKQDNDSWIRELLASRCLSQDKLAFIYREIKEQGILDYVSSLCKRYFSRAEGLLNELPPSQARKDFLFLIDLQNEWSR